MLTSMLLYIWRQIYYSELILVPYLSTLSISVKYWFPIVHSVIYASVIIVLYCNLWLFSEIDFILIHWHQMTKKLSNAIVTNRKQIWYLKKITIILRSIDLLTSNFLILSYTSLSTSISNTDSVYICRQWQFFSLYPLYHLNS